MIKLKNPEAMWLGDCSTGTYQERAHASRTSGSLYTSKRSLHSMTALRSMVAKRKMARAVVQSVAACGVLTLTVLSAILAKERFGVPLANIQVSDLNGSSINSMGLGSSIINASMNTSAINTLNIDPSIDLNSLSPDATQTPMAKNAIEPIEVAATPAEELTSSYESLWGEVVFDAKVRWFNGRPVRPARVIWMTVTAYSPDERSCGIYADGITATLHSVTTNGHRLVAADPKVLPYGSMLTVPGYGRESIVPVLDCGGAIKGRRLDVLFPTHEQALVWGVRRIPITVWEYADGKPKDNPRKLR